MIEDYQIEQVTGEAPSTIHHALRATRRRIVVTLISHQCLSDEPHQIGSREVATETNRELVISARELAREIVAVEEDIKKSHATGEDYHNAYTALTQTHLPFLAEIGAIKYNPNRKTVTPDHNLLPLAVISNLSSEVAELIFYGSIAQFYTAGKSQSVDAIDD